MTETAIAPGPVVRMCDDPACKGFSDCPAANADRERIGGRTVGLTEIVPQDREVTDEAVCRILAFELGLGRTADSSGVQRMLADGAEFRVHRGEQEATGVPYAALYSGPGDSIDAALGAEWTEDRSRERVSAMGGPA